MKIYTTTLLLLLGLTSCVSNKKIAEATATADQKVKDCASEKKELREENLDQRQRIVELEAAWKQMIRDTSTYGEQYRSANASRSDMTILYDKMKEQNDALLNATSSEKQILAEELGAKETTLLKKERELARLEKDLKALQSNLALTDGENVQLLADMRERELKADELQRDAEMLKYDLQQRENRVNELESILDNRDRQIDALRIKIKNELMGYKESELTVVEKDSKVYISLSQQLLFASGSAYLDTKGRKAIQQLAAVLNKNPEILITVEGHTDNVAMKSGNFKDNWDLSVLRATSIVRELVKGGVSPTRVTASGRSEYFPISSNTTTTGKAKNRRTEIILSPNLDEVWKLLGN